jgi:hypothetical protein
MMLNHRQFRVAIMSAILILLGAGLARSTPAQAFSPVYYNNTNYNGTNIHYIQVDLNDAGTFITPIGAGNHLPKYNFTDPEPRWDDNMPHTQGLLNMYNGTPFSDKVAMINTDYFCRSGCVGNAGAPQGEFVRDGTKYQWPGNHKRAALRFDSSNTASITTYGPYVGNDGSNISGYRQIVSGSPITLWQGSVSCRPLGEEDPSNHCGTTIYRTAACISSNGKTLWLLATATATTWNNLANFMKNQLGCYSGMEFDGGTTTAGSTSMVYKGSSKVTGGAVGTGLLVRWRSGCPCLATP